LNQEGTYSALYVNVEMGETARGDVGRGMKAILTELAYQAERTLGDTSYRNRISEIIAESGEDAALKSLLSDWCKRLKLPLVLCIDDVDAFVGDTLVSLLRQIRSGYPERATELPSSIILCDVHDVRDYRIHSDREKEIVTGGRAFNIKAKSLRLGNFSEEETKTLLQQHTTETGQIFEDDAISAIWALTKGQPWLVNALAYKVCFELPMGKTGQIILHWIRSSKKKNVSSNGGTHTLPSL